VEIRRLPIKLGVQARVPNGRALPRPNWELRAGRNDMGGEIMRQDVSLIHRVEERVASEDIGGFEAEPNIAFAHPK
jgi:hypothetical protein